jgi:hypothetical protein
VKSDKPENIRTAKKIVNERRFCEINEPKDEPNFNISGASVENKSQNLGKKKDDLSLKKCEQIAEANKSGQDLDRQALVAEWEKHKPHSSNRSIISSLTFS